MMPVINLTFLLLLFFVVAGNLQEAMTDTVDLPLSASENITEVQTPELRIRSDGQLTFKEKITTVESWVQFYQQTSVALPTKVRILADKNTPGAVFMPVLDALKLHHVKQVALVTKSKSSAQP